jgi:hypothetical protein
MGTKNSSTASAAPSRRPASTNFQLVDPEVLGAVTFGADARQSPYRRALQQLASSPDKWGVFGSVKCRYSVKSAAQKLGLKIEMAEQNGSLVVRIASGKCDAQPGTPARRPHEPSTTFQKPGSALDALREIITAKQGQTNGQLLKALHERGMRNITPDSLSAMLSTLKSKDLVYKADHDLCWYLGDGKPKGVRA